MNGFILLFYSHELESHNLKLQVFDKDEQDFLGYFLCRNNCGLVFSTKSTRNRWLRLIKTKMYFQYCNKVTLEHLCDPIVFSSSYSHAVPLIVKKKTSE